MTLLREAIGDSLRRARIAQSRTLREVSTSARVSLGYLSEVERGRKEASSRSARATRWNRGRARGKCIPVWQRSRGAHARH